MHPMYFKKNFAFSKYICITCTLPTSTNTFGTITYVDLNKSVSNCLSIDISRKIDDLNDELAKQKRTVQALSGKLDTVLEKLEQMALYHPVIGSEVHQFSSAFSVRAQAFLPE